jgi:hypothetical protein
MSAVLTPLRCLGCSHEWHEPIINNVRVAVWQAHVKSLTCPQCGANWRRLAFRLEREIDKKEYEDYIKSQSI